MSKFKNALLLKCDRSLIYYMRIIIFSEKISLSFWSPNPKFPTLSVEPLSQPRSLQLVAEFPRRDRRDAYLQSLRSNFVVSCAKAHHSWRFNPDMIAKRSYSQFRCVRAFACLFSTQSPFIIDKFEINLN